MIDDKWLSEIFSEDEPKDEPKANQNGTKKGIPEVTLVLEDPPRTEEEESLEGDGEEDALSEDEEIQRDMYEAQTNYEAELNRYPDTHPKNLFKHSFMHSGYLPCMTVKAKKTVQADPDEVAQELVKNAYLITSSGSMALNHVMFCKIWHERFNYVYAGYILTPDGQIEPDTFRSEIVKMLFNMNTETKNLDVLAEHIYKTYISAYKVDAYEETNKIPFRNGDLYLNEDRKGFTFYEGCKSAVPYRFDYDFHNIPNCFEPKFPHFKKWRDGLFDEEDVYSLKQMLGYLLLPTNEAQEAFFIIGKAGSGKSILTDCVLPTMLGDALFPISIGQFFNDKFQIGTSEGKLCMVDDDIGEARLSYEDSGRFKNFVTARTIKIEHKHCNPVKINNSARIVCAGNHMINSDDKTDGFTRRLHPIYVKPRTIEDVDTRLPGKIASEIEMIVLWALEGLLEVMNADGVPYSSDRTQQQFRYYSEGQKWEEQFIRDAFAFKEGEVTYSQDIKDALDDWLKDNAEISGEGSLTAKFADVTKWMKDEGADKFGYIYKRGMKRGDTYNARGYINMALKMEVSAPMIYSDEKGVMKLRVTRKKPVVEVEKEKKQ